MQASTEENETTAFSKSSCDKPHDDCAIFVSENSTAALHTATPPRRRYASPPPAIMPPSGGRLHPAHTHPAYRAVRVCRHTIARNAKCKHFTPRCGDKSPQAPLKTVPFRLPYHGSLVRHERRLYRHAAA